LSPTPQGRPPKSGACHRKICDSLTSLEQKFRHARDDPHQLGADFIVDADGNLRFAHWSDDPTDRPDVDALSSMLQQVQSRKEE